MSITLKQTYTKNAIPALRKEFAITNVMAVPRVLKVVINTGTGRNRKEGELMKKIERDLSLLAGQKATARAAKKSVSSFKLREGETVGYAVTLRGTRMWDFLQRLLALALPLSKDFRGIETTNVDKAGNLNLGIREHSIFPEIVLENIKDVFGLQVTVVTNAQNHDRGLALFRHLGFPFKK